MFLQAASEKKKKVLVLGAGYVSAPVFEYLSRDDTIQLTIVSKLQEELDRLVDKYNHCRLVLHDFDHHPKEIEQLVAKHDLVISLLPHPMHPSIAKLCIKYKKDMVTPSYLLEDLKALNTQAIDAGITILNEIGVDPGIDHFLAMDVIFEAHEHGGVIESYVSWCGGLPAPEFCNNPLLYKFSWSPIGMLLASKSAAKYLLNGELVEIAENMVLEHAKVLDIVPGLSLEGYPNRDSTHYAEEYGIEKAHTIIRGTLRYKGFSDVMKGLMRMGYLDLDPIPALDIKGPDVTWKQLLCGMLNEKENILDENLLKIVQEHFDLSPSVVKSIGQLGLFDDELVVRKSTPIDTLAHYLNNRLSFDDSEKDMILMHHEIGILWPDGTREKKNVDLVVYGTTGADSSRFAMAKTVGYAIGIASKMVLDGEIKERGTLTPLKPEVFKTMLSRLKTEGITAQVISIPLKDGHVSF